MNKSKLEQCLWQRVRLRPMAQRRMTDGTWLPPIDDEWIVTEVNAKGVRISNPRTGHAPLLGFDHIHHYNTDPARDWDGLTHGQLELNRQLTLSGCNVSNDPVRVRRPRGARSASRT